MQSESRRPLNWRLTCGGLALALLILATYANHFENGFHFDDSHSIVDNPFIRGLHNIPRFFTSSETASVLPSNRAWRPLVMTSFAVDYWLGHGLAPFYFHLSTMVWFLVELGLMYLLFRQAFDRCLPDPRNAWAALFAAALYGIHPAMAETVNYIVQRAELYCTLGSIAGLVMYTRWPLSRRTGLYLLPVAAAVVSKTPAVVFPAILFVYLWLIEEEKPTMAMRRCLPSLGAVIALAWLTAAMTPKSLNPGASSAYEFLISQPFVLTRFVRIFFFPAGLNADIGRIPFSSVWQPAALAGFLFLAGLIALTAWTARRRKTRPIAFGLCWFLIAALPTAIFPVAEVDNDHRMFFPFVGLALSACWTAALVLYRGPVSRLAVASVCALLLAGCGYGTILRNRVWRTEESLWRDVTLKSPHNGRGLMNYGLTLMAKGDYPDALDYFQRASVRAPNYSSLEINLGIVNGALHNTAEAEKHFLRALQLAPAEASPRFFYARWLRENGRVQEAAQHLRIAVQLNPTYIDAQYLLMQTDADLFDTDDLRATAQRTLANFPGDKAAASWLARAASFRPTPEAYLNQSLAAYQAGRYADSITDAQKALELRPGYWQAWNNIAAGWNAQSNWNEGIRAADEAVRLNPNNQLAKNNLAWAKSQKLSK